MSSILTLELMGGWLFTLIMADDLDLYIMSKPDVSADGVSLLLPPNTFHTLLVLARTLLTKF
jgi:hypothetical protein